MTFNNPVKGSWLNVVFHLYMISCNPVKGSWQDIVFHSYMISCNPVKGSWQDIVLSFIIILLDITKYNPLKNTTEKHRKKTAKPKQNKA